MATDLSMMNEDERKVARWRAWRTNAASVRHKDEDAALHKLAETIKTNLFLIYCREIDLTISPNFNIGTTIRRTFNSIYFAVPDNYKPASTTYFNPFIRKTLMLS